MNERKEVLSWVCAKSTGFIHVRHALPKVKERCDKEKVEIQGLIIDNCCLWRALLEDIFGPVPIKLDLFHGVKRMTRTNFRILGQKCIWKAKLSEKRMIYVKA